MNTKIKALVTLSALPALLSFASPVQAAVRCETQYGGGQVCVKTGNIQINKQIQGSDGVWYDNLGPQSGVRFKSGDVITYRLHVSNVGDAKFDSVTVTDTLPGQLKLAEGNLTNTITNLEAGQSQDIFVKGKVNTASSTLDCNAINVVEARTNDNQYDKDTAQICIQEGSAPQVKTLPKAGANENLIALGFSALAAMAGTLLIKKAKARL
jgi:uncharacterized repeat protein (TIGR01451 family)